MFSLIYWQTREVEKKKVCFSTMDVNVFIASLWPWLKLHELLHISALQTTAHMQITSLCLVCGH